MLNILCSASLVYNTSHVFLLRDLPRFITLHFHTHLPLRNQLIIFTMSLLDVEARSHRCGACLFGLPPNITPISADLSVKGPFKPNYKHHHGGEGHDVEFSVIQQSAARGCLGCSAIQKALEEHHGHEGTEYIVWDKNGFWQGPTGAVWDVFLPMDGDKLNDSNAARPSPINQHIHPFLGRLSTPSGDTSSPRAVDALLGWNRQCLASHTHCGSGLDQLMPHRVLKIENHDECRVRLVEGRTYGRYAALSHRWCSKTPGASLTKAQIDIFRTQVPNKLFYPLLRDAIKICGHLEIEFIWIDCMCIVQDDPADWATEASQMASIYENASLVIAGSGCSEDEENGLHSSSLNKYPPKEIIKVHDEPVHIRPQLSHPVWRDQGKLTEFSISAEYPLMSRGWVFQERALAKRTVHFTREELVWECTEAVWCECMSGEIRTPAESHTLLLRDVQKSTWNSIVSWYSMLNLTFADDRLPALGGIARRYGEPKNLTYMAGLWKETWQEDFFWERGNEPKPRPWPLPAPTWSWASISGHVRVVKSDDQTKLCHLLTLVGYQAKPIQGGDIYGRLLQPVIYIRGPLLRATIHQGQDWTAAVKKSDADERAKRILTCKPGTEEYDLDKCGFTVGEKAFLLSVDYNYLADDRYSVESGSSIFILVAHDSKDGSRVVAQGLVLQSLDTTKQVYQRVGCFGTRTNFNVPSAAWFLERSSNLQITIT